MKFTTNINQLYNALNAGLIHVSTDDTRPHYLNCVYMEIKKASGCKVVAIDGHRMSVYDLHIDIDKEITGEYLLEYDGTKYLVSMLKKYLKFNYNVIIDENSDKKKLEFRFGDTSVSVNLKDDQFPPWEKVMPDGVKMRKGIKAIGLNPLYVGDTAKAFGMKKSNMNQMVEFRFKGELDPVLVTHSSMPELKIIIMPMRI
jgi:DNA polymerase III sliding clamp (beta) subunit (PCNA family)